MSLRLQKEPKMMKDVKTGAYRLQKTAHTPGTLTSTLAIRENIRPTRERSPVVAIIKQALPFFCHYPSLGFLLGKSRSRQVLYRKAMLPSTETFLAFS